MKNLTALDAYDAGYLNAHGGGNVEWWHDYIRSELDRAHDFYQSQLDGQPIRYEVPEGWQLVPVQLTPEMWDAMNAGYQSPACSWEAALSAAPKPEASQ